MVSSSVIQAPLGQTKVEKTKPSKNPGLSLRIVRSQSEQANNIRSPVNDTDINDEAQYVLIHSDSPFYKGVPPPRTPAYLSFTGFAFACDALSGEDVFTKTPHELFEEELQNRTFPESRPSKQAKVSKNSKLLLNLTQELSSPSQRVFVRRRPGTANSFTNTPGLEPSSDTDSDSDCDNDEGVQFVYVPANSPFNTPASTSRTTSAYLPLSAIPFACDALAEEDPLFLKSPTDLLDGELLHSAVPADTENGVVVVDLENSGREPLITREWIQNTHSISVSKEFNNEHDVEPRVFQQYL